MSLPDLICELEKSIAPDRILRNPGQLAPYESDALTAYQVRPGAVVLVENQSEVVTAVRACHRFEVPFVARGSGTSLSGGSLPVKDGIVIALNRLNRILKLDPEQRLAVVEPGVINLEISRAAAGFGMYYAPDPSSQPICTIGGNLGFNAGGAHCLKYGMTSNHVLGVKVLLPDGEVVWSGSESRENVGPDLTGLFVGSEGLLGIALEVVVRLLPLPETRETVLAAYSDLETAGKTVSQIIAAGLVPAAIEIMDRLAMDAAEAAVQAGYPPEAQALLIVEVDGEANSVAEDFMQVMAVISASGASEVQVAQSANDRMLIWKGRKSAFSAVGRLSPDFLVQDGVVPRSRLGEALAEIGRLSEKYGLRVANVFHAGDGNLHPLILYNGREAGALAQAEELAGEILRLCVAFGGSITGEHGIGVEKRNHLPVMFNQATIASFKALRRVMDPLEIANRGKMFPLGS